MTDNQACAAVPNQIPERLAFLSTFAEQLAAESDGELLSCSILHAFSQLSCPLFAALWTIREGQSVYSLGGYIGSPPSELSTTFSSSDPLVGALSVVSTVLWRHDLAHTSPGVGEAIRRLLDVYSADLVVSLKQDGRLLGFCVLRLDHPQSPDDGTLKALFQMAAHISASAIQRRLQNSERGHAQILLRRTDRLRSLEVIAGALAHEIRNPLTSIKTFVQLAPGRRFDAGFMEEFSRVAVEDIHRIEHLLQDIFDYARYLVPTPAEENLNALVQSCLSFVSMKASDHSIRLRSELAEGLPFMPLDRQQIKQAVINLLLNAIDACGSEGREIVVRTWIGQQSSDTPCAVIEVQDDGEGIAPEHLEHIFDPFFTTKHSNSSTEIRGLGLTIAHQIVHEHQGAITVESRPGGGSTFRVSLPILAPQFDGTFIRE